MVLFFTVFWHWFIWVCLSFTLKCFSSSFDMNFFHFSWLLSSLLSSENVCHRNQHKTPVHKSGQLDDKWCRMLIEDSYSMCSVAAEGGLSLTKVKQSMISVQHKSELEAEFPLRVFWSFAASHFTSLQRINLYRIYIHQVWAAAVVWALRYFTGVKIEGRRAAVHWRRYARVSNLVHTPVNCYSRSVVCIEGDMQESHVFRCVPTPSPPSPGNTW